MKKLLYLLLLMPLAFLASCDNDDDMPQVDLTVTLSNVYQDSSNGDFYYVEDEDQSPLIVDGISAKSLLDGKAATVTNVFYYLNNVVRLFGTEEKPFSPVIPADYFAKGVNYINISATILQVDKNIANCYVEVPVKVVESIDNLPENIGDQGTYNVTLRMQPKK